MNRSARSSIPSTLLTDLLAALGETKVSHDPLNLAAVAPDASHYLLTPGAVSYTHLTLPTILLV